MATTLYDVIMKTTDSLSIDAVQLSKKVYDGLLVDSDYSTQLKQLKDERAKRDDDWRGHRQDTKERRRKHYHYIPLSARAFIPFATFARYAAARMLDKDPADVTFIDVGSGIGEKPMWAQEFCGYKYVTGLEYNKHTHKIAVERVGNRPNTTLIQGDAFDHDFSKYDVIYMYCPISSEKVMARLWWHIFQTVKPGALIIDTLTPYMYDVVKAHPEIIEDAGHRAKAVTRYFSSIYTHSHVMRYRTENGTMGVLNSTGDDVPLERRM